MNRLVLFVATVLTVPCGAPVNAGETALDETVPLSMSHSIGWVRSHAPGTPDPGWSGVLDEVKWGTPSPQQILSRVWSWKPTDTGWQNLVQEKGEAPAEDVRFELWIPDGLKYVRGVVVLSGHGSGEGLFKRADLRALAGELGLALFKFTGNPVQRGFWPRRLLFERLESFGARSAHPELSRAPLFLYGHSNGTGFSALFAAAEKERVWGWVSMRPGITFQVAQPDAATVPGLVIFGEDDPFLARPSVAENLEVLPHLRKTHRVLWASAVEPKTGHGPGEKTWPLVYSFLRHSFQARVPAPAGAAPEAGPVHLRTLAEEGGHLGQPWDPAVGGYQTLRAAPYAETPPGERAASLWLLNGEFAADWRAFQAGEALHR